MRSFSTLHSPPPSPHQAPIPLAASSLACCPELDLSVTLSPAPKPGHSALKPLPLEQIHRTGQLQRRRSHPQGQTGRKRNTQVCFEEPVVATVTPEPYIPLSRDAPLQQPATGPRRRRVRNHGGALRHSVDTPVSSSTQDPGCLERAELNTTLALKGELQSLQEAEFDSQKAVQETLQRSERTKNLINARATEVVNVSRSQLLFNSLVSVDVREDQLLGQALQERLHLAPPPPPPPPRRHDAKGAEGPSPLFFVTPDLLAQKPLPPEDEPVACKLWPTPRPACSTFDLYGRQRCWDATP